MGHADLTNARASLVSHNKYQQISKRSAMGTISVLKTATVESSLPELNYGKAGCQPVSLLAFLQAENLRLKTQLAELQRDTTALGRRGGKTEPVAWRLPM
jgi:hypothetical protein